MDKNKTISIIISIVFVIGIIIVFSKPSQDSVSVVDAEPTQNVEIRDGIQYVTIDARGGYSPRMSTAEANIPTKLVVRTNGTYDCSVALVIRSIGYREMLPPTGEEIIDLGVPKSGALQGLCSMGMYNFTVNFISSR